MIVIFLYKEEETVEQVTKMKVEYILNKQQQKEWKIRINMMNTISIVKCNHYVSL